LYSSEAFTKSKTSKIFKSLNPETMRRIFQVYLNKRERGRIPYKKLHFLEIEKKFDLKQVQK